MRDAFRALAEFAQRHPLWTTGFSFLPLLLGAGIVKAVRGVGQFFASEAKEVKGKVKTTVQETETIGGELLEEFKGFGKACVGDAGIDGVIKIIQMLVYVQTCPFLSPCSR